jgi:16S rRNA (adenine1518-N6/adenine1519-N6)-dimethyltransferase
MKYLGQHFLKNQNVIEQIVTAVDVRAGETIVEVGPGRGALTIPLSEACRKVGANLIAVEKDEKMAERLKSDGATGDVTIIIGDVLHFLKTIADAPAGNRRHFKIVGNIPYYITGYLLRTISELDPKPELCVLMLQKEVAERACAKPPRMNRLAASVQLWAEPMILIRVPKGDFLPPPKVDSAVISLQAKQPQADADRANRYYAAVRAIFAQPRKKILNNLAADLRIAIHPKAEIVQRLASLGITSGLRPQNLTIENISDIAEAFY